mgnify:CR=1 FL=1
MFNLFISEEIRTPLTMFRATGPSVASSGETLIFSSVLDNFSDGYNADTGRFTAPSKGLYIFSLSLCTVGNVDARFGIETDGSFSAAKRLIDQDRDSCGTIVSPILLTKGQQVHAECVQSCDVTSGYGTNTNLFAGSLIHYLK